MWYGKGGEFVRTPNGSSYSFMPSAVDSRTREPLLSDIIHCAMEQTGDAREKVCDKIAGTMAKEVAIVVGQLLSQEEMSALIDDLFNTSMPSHTPDGKPVIHIMNDTEIDRNFMK